MQLSYRGINYDYTPPAVTIASSDIAGQYDGVDVRFRHQKKAPVQQTTVDLKYRGIPYTTTIEQQARVWTLQTGQRQDNRQRSMIGRLRAEIMG